MQKPKAIQVFQNDTTITIELKVEKTVGSDPELVDIDVSNCDVVFTADPYFLRLKFNQPLVEGGPNFHIEVQTQAYIIRLGKLNYKEHFTGLDQPDLLVQAIDEELRDVLEYQEESKSEEFLYGFNNEVNFEIPQEICELAGCVDPRKIPADSRLMNKCQIEQGLFSEDRYIQDNYDEETLEQIQQVTSLEMPSLLLEELMENLNLKSSQDPDLKQDYIKAVAFDLLFAYLYEYRFQFFGSLSDTSVMNITQLSQTLSNHINPNSWQNPNNRAKAYLVSNFRRVLIFAIFRNYDLCLRVKNDVCQLNKQQTISLLEELLQLFSSKGINMQFATYYIKQSLEYVKLDSQFNFEEFKAIEVTKVDLCLQLELIDNELN